VFIQPDAINEEPSFKFRADNLMQETIQVDNLIATLENRMNMHSQILFKGHFKDPQIPFISVDLSDPCADKSQGALRVRAMHDSGCAKTTIRTDIFKRIPNAEKIQINQMPNVFVQSCSAEKAKILGHAALKFTFQGKNGKIASFIHDVLITDFVQHPLLVDRDFTGSQAKLMETNSHIYLTENPQDADTNSENSNVANVPIITQFLRKLLISNTLDILVPPQTLTSVPCTLIDTVDLRLFLKQKSKNIFLR
jgi:hypothetical protein